MKNLIFKSSFYEKLKLLIIPMMLLTLGVGQMWAGAGLYEVYFEYSYNGSNKTKTCTSSSGESNDLGTLTADFKLTSIYPKVWKDGSGNICGCLVEYYISSDQEITGFTYDKSLGGNNHQWKRTTAFTVAQYNTGASGSYTFWYRFKAWGSSSSSSNCGDNNYYIPTDGSSKNKFTYKIAPPNVTGYTVSINNRVAGDTGDGTEANPYIITWGVNPTVSVSSPSQARTDASSRYEYKFGSASWGTGTSTTISPSTTKASITIKARKYNTSASIESPSTNDKTIWYKWETPYTITVQTNGVGTGTVNKSTVYTKGDVASASFTASVPSADAAKYEFVNWTATSGVTLQSANTAATNTVKATGNGTVTANFQAKQYNISYNPSTASHCTYTTKPTSARYGNTVNLKIDPDANYVISSVTVKDASNNSVPVSGSSPNYSFTMPASNATVTIVTALSSITVNYGAGANGSLAAKQGGISIGASGSTVDGGSTVNFTATPNTYYEVEGWYTNSACTEGKHDAGSTTYNAVANSTLNVYVKFKLIDYAITYYLNSGTNSGSNPATYTYETATITLQDPSRSYYTFQGWYTESGFTNRVYNIPNHSSGEKAFWAKWSENMTTVNLVASPTGAGTFTVNSSTVTSTSAGKTTNPSVTAVAAAGYYVKTSSTVWSKNNNNISLSSTTAASTTVTGCGTAATATDLTATFTEKYLLCGSRNDGNDTPAGMRGWSTSGDNSAYQSVVYNNGVLTIQANLTAAGAQYKFKLRNQQGSAWEGQTGSSSMSDGDQWTFDGSNDVYFTTTVAGVYTFTIDQLTAASPRVKITFPGEPEYGVTLQTDGTYDASVSPTGAQNIKPVTHTNISANIPAGYRFAGWTVDGEHNSDIHFGDASSASTWVTADAGGAGATITANFTTDGMIYLKKTGIKSAWSGKVWVYFYTSAYWNNDKGSGSNRSDVKCREMTRLGMTDIYYYNYGDDSDVTSSHINSHVICFTDKYLPSSNDFYQCSAIYRTDFNECATMFVVENYITDRKNSSAYYNNGYWMKFNKTTPGVSLHIWKKANNEKVGEYTLTSAAVGNNEFKNSVTLDGNTEYYFKLGGCNGQWYGNNGTMTTTNCTGWDFLQRNNNNCYITTTAHGSYPFIVTCTDVGVLKVSVEFPLAVGDYRVMYYGKMNSLGSASNVNHESRFVRGLSAAGTAKDTVSFFAISGDNTWTLQLQKCTALSPNVTWTNQGSAITSLRSSVTETGVHNFVVNQNHNGSTNTVTVSYGGKYTGNFYIRTDCAAGGWEAYKETADNLMTYSDVAKESGYDYYYCHWVEKPRNIQFTVANDYSDAISVNFVRETEAEMTNITRYVNADGTLNGRDANVRFMYNSANNYVGRAYIDGANDVDNNFLKILSSDSKLFAAAEGGSSLTELKFSDNGNWIYEADVYSLPQSQIKLRAQFGASPNFVTQWFKGGASSTVQLINGTGSSRYKIRLVYDFKTNRLVTAWLPSGTITTDQSINADVMFIRVHQEPVTALAFNNATITNVKTAYAVLQLNKWTLNNKSTTGEHPNLTGNNILSANERNLYYISFPFDVKLSEVFGFGEYGKHWAVQHYDGATRAANGYWIDSEPNWKYYPSRDGVTLYKNQGYIIGLDLDNLGTTSDVWKNTDEVELYFPSSGVIGSLSSATVPVTVPEHWCSINRGTPDGDRRFKDSHWNCVGVPTYMPPSSTSATGTSDYNTWKVDTETAKYDDYTAGYPNFVYIWTDANLHAGNKTLTPTAIGSVSFKAMYAYLMQFAGTINYVASGPVASNIAARRSTGYKSEYLFRLELAQNEKMVDQTYLKLMDDENVTTDYDFNYDLIKEGALGSSIYSFIRYEKVAGNCLPLVTDQQTTVPVGVVAKTTGEYTFAMPDGTEGLSVTLVDNFTGAHTNLALGDYMVELEAGTYEERFTLVIDPRTTTTAVETVGGEGNDAAARKVFINGLMYIQRGEHLYDAQGRKVE